MQLHTFNGVSVSQGVAMEVMIQAMEMEANKKPNATLDDLSWDALIDWKAGAGKARIFHANGHQETKDFPLSSSPGQSRLESVLVLSNGDTVHLIPDTGASFTVAVGNGTISVEPGLVKRPLVSSDPRPGDSEEQLAVRKWLAEGKLGTSSKTMAHVLYGLPEDMSPSSYDGPHDPSDFMRCLGFLEYVPQARARLAELAQTPGWESLVPNFDELEQLYITEKEQGTGRAPKLYERLRQLRRPQTRSPKP